MGCACGKSAEQKSKNYQKKCQNNQGNQDEIVEQDQAQRDQPVVQKHFKNQKSIGSYQGKLVRKQTFEENGIMKTIEQENDFNIPDNLSEYMTNRNIDHLRMSLEFKISMIGHSANSNQTKVSQYLQMLKLNNFSKIDIKNFKNANIPLDQLDFQTLRYSKQFNQFRQYHYFKQNELKAIKSQDAVLSELKAQEMLNKVKQNNYNFQSCGEEIALLALKEYYENQGINLTFKSPQQQQKDEGNDQLNKTMNSICQQQIDEKQDDYDEIQKHLTQTGFDLETYYQIRLEDDSDQWYYEKAENNKRNFAQYFKSEILKQYKNLKEDDINILNIQKGSIIVDFIISSQLDSIKIGKQKFDNIPAKYIVSELQIKDKYFNPKYNMTWENSNAVFERGNINGVKQQYHLPVGYYGLGLDVLNSVYKDDGWLNSDTNDATWIVLFHATKPQFVPNILKQGLKAGSGQMHQSKDCRFGRGKIGTGVYFSNKVDKCEQFGAPIKVGEKQYRMIFQCRVNPKTVKSPKDVPEYYVCNNPKDARPYRILIKEIKQSS